jgi:hypothetical protein
MQRPKDRALIHLSDLSREKVALAYIKMSTVLTFHTLLSERRFLPLCVFDSVNHDPLPAIEEAFPELQRM